MGSSLRNKTVLVTAGPTWAAIDKVRVISNISTGATGIAIARAAARQGAKVTLLLGPATLAVSFKLSAVSIRIIRFRYFEELQRLLQSELRRKYDIIIHAAAVSDYRPVRVSPGKIRSGVRHLTLSLQQTPKLIDTIRKRAPQAFLVMFKLEAGKSEKALITTARRAMLKAGADLVVANNVEAVFEGGHRAYIIDSGKRMIKTRTKKALAESLMRTAAKNYKALKKEKKGKRC